MLRIVALLLPAAIFLCAGAAARAQTQKPQISVEQLERAIHDLINRERKTHKLGLLEQDAELAVVARDHSADMARRGYFSHNTPEGVGFGERYRRGQYNCMLKVGSVIHMGAENIARMVLYASILTINGVKHHDWNSEEKIARDTVAGWMASPGHRANILTGHWRRQGIGLVIGADDRVYVTQNFC